jgi:hypothetical protein
MGSSHTAHSAGIASVQDGVGDCDGDVAAVWMKLHRRNGFLDDQGNALMDKRIVPAAAAELQ